MSLIYNKSEKELKKIIEKVSEEVFKGFIDTDNYFSACDKSGKGFVVYYNRNQWSGVE